MLHAVLGTSETLADHRSYLLSWPDPCTRMRMRRDGTMENLGPLQQDVHPMLDDLLRLRARRQLRDCFGEVDQARYVLRALTALLDEMDDPAFAVSEEDDAKRDTRAKRRPDGDASGF